MCFQERRILTHCAPVFGEMTADTWNRSWHGVQQVAEQFLKLQYYRFYVLPLKALRGGPRRARRNSTRDNQW